MPFTDALLAGLSFFWDLLKTWLYTLGVSFANLSTVWIITPIWISWFFAEFFQEKEGTSFGNAISNGVVPLWVGIDWIRQITGQLMQSGITFSALVFGKYLISAIVIIYGFTIIVGGIQGKEFIRYLGRIREITYVLVVFTPFIYGIIEPNYFYFISIIIFFPAFYWIIEVVDRMTPEPEVLKKDREAESSGVEGFEKY